MECRKKRYGREGVAGVMLLVEAEGTVMKQEVLEAEWASQLGGAKQLKSEIRRLDQPFPLVSQR